MSCQSNLKRTYHIKSVSINYFPISVHELRNWMPANLSINVQPAKKILTYPASVAELKRQKKPGSGRTILHPLLVSIHSSATFTPTPVYCVDGGGGAQTGARFLATDRAQRGASVRRRCEDKIRVITALQLPRLIRRQALSPASQHDIFCDTDTP